MIAELVGEHLSLPLEYLRARNVRALGDEAARAAPPLKGTDVTQLEFMEIDV